MKTYKVEMIETLKYEIEVTAENAEEAEEAAYASEEFRLNLFKDNDAAITRVEKVTNEKAI